MYALIPARGGSRRIPRKNIKELGGKPLIQWSIESARLLPVRDIVVSTEDREIAQVASALGVTVLMRPEELASDMATDHDVVGHFLTHFECGRIVYLRPTTPFRKPEVLAAIVKAEYVDTSSVRSVQVMPESAFKCFTRDKMGGIEPIRKDGVDYANFPNQLCPKTYAANGYADILFPKEDGFSTTNVFGERIYGFVTLPTIELDTPEQWAHAEYLIEKGLV